MLGDFDWCNIYHVCVGSRDNIFLCPPGTVFNETKQGCMDRFDGTNCNGTRSYFKPSMKRDKRLDPIWQEKMRANLESPSITSKVVRQERENTLTDNYERVRRIGERVPAAVFVRSFVI
jgi:hypothetical protein